MPSHVPVFTVPVQNRKITAGTQSGAGYNRYMKVLILNGGGHNSVSAALKECFLLHGDVADIRDSLSFISDTVSDVISFSHIFMYRHLPTLQNNAYFNTEKKGEIFQEERLLRRFINLGQTNLGRLIQERGYDAVVCTHVFGAMMLTEAVKNFDLKVRTAIVETDYCNTPGSSNNEMDRHFVAYDGLIPELISQGVPEETIVISGIPVRSQIFRQLEKPIAKHLLGIPEDHDHILMMGGSMGCGPISELLEILHRRLDENTDISVVCGTNTKMKREMDEQYPDSQNIHIFGYMPDMSWIYSASDIFVTKPGGICTTEAAVLGLPMVLVSVVGACEQFNLEYFTENGAALTGNDENELADCCEELLFNREKRAAISAKLPQLVHADAAEIIYENIKK